MAIKNDLSFVIDSQLSLYKHQSTYSPNLPPPRFIIFYNGEEAQPDRRILKLSDLYEVERTITECIWEGSLEEFLRKYRAEAKRMSIYEYDQARHIRQEREEAREEGRQEGIEQGRLSMIRRMLEGGASPEEIKRLTGATEKEVEKARNV